MALNSPDSGQRRLIPPPPGPFDEPQADQRDIDVATAFGVRHSDVFGGIWVVGPQIHVALTQVEPYGDELRGLMADPANLHIVPVRGTMAELKEIQQRISTRLRAQPGLGFCIGIEPQNQRLVLRMGAAGVDLARELHEQFGDLLGISIGGRAYPPDGAPVSIAAAPVATRSFPGLVVTAELKEDRVPSGAGWAGEVELRNAGTDLIAFDTDQPVIGSVIDAAETVVGSFSGTIAGTGLLVRLSPGASRTIRFLGGTNGGSGDQYSTAPGDYHAVVVIPVRDDEPGGQLVSTPTDLHIS